MKNENDAEEANDSLKDTPNMQLSDGTDQLHTPPKDFDEHCVTVKPDFSSPTPIAKTANKVIAGRVTKMRASPRKIQKPDYTHLHDSFATLDADTDGDGERVFGDEPSSSEDSAAEDGAFEGGEVEDVPMEG